MRVTLPTLLTSFCGIGHCDCLRIELGGWVVLGGGLAVLWGWCGGVCFVLVQASPLRWVFCSLLSLACSRRDSGQYSPRPLLNSRARWFLLSQGVPSATLMPLSEVLVVLLSLSCLILHGSEGSARARTLGVHLCSTYGCSVGLWLVGWFVVLLMRYLGIV